MGEGFDQIGKKNMMRENREKRKGYEQTKKGMEEAEAKMDEYTHIIQNIVCIFICVTPPCKIYLGFEQS